VGKTNDVYLGNPLLKRAHTETELTYEQIIELARCEQDPLYFASNYIQIVTLDHGLQPFSLYKFQEKMLRTFHDNRFIICKLPRQPLSLDTPVPTPRGWSTIGKLKIGDKVFSSAGQPTKIVAKSEVYIDADCYKINLDCGESIIAESDHLWEVFESGDRTVLPTKILFEHKDKNYYLKRAQLKGKDKRFPDDWDKEIKIVSIEKTDTVPVACIEVEDTTHMFLCGKNFIPQKNCGKSTTVVSYLIHSLIFNEKFSIAILANKASTAKDLLARLAVSYENLPKWIQAGVKSWNKTSVELENGSKVMAASTSASAVRGGSYNIIFLDEFAFVPNQIASNFMNSVYPTITSGDNSKVIIVSCVTKDTYLLTPDGYRKMETLIDEDKDGAYFTEGYTVRGKDKFYKGEIVVNSGKAPTNIIKTRLGTLECSEKHKLWAYKDGKYDYFKSSELSVGDYVSLRYNEQIYGNQDYVGFYPDKNKNKNVFSCDYITPDVAYFVGLYVSEGYARKIFKSDGVSERGGQIVISCGDDVSEVLTRLDIKYTKKDEVHYSINSLHLVKFLEFLGFDITKKAPRKILPNKVLSWSKENLIALLQGMFDGDGCATKIGSVSYTSTSYELVRQVQLLLANMGILTSYYERTSPPSERVKVSSTNHNVEATGLFAKKFFEEIGFRFERKQNRLSLLKVSKREGNQQDVINDSIRVIRENIIIKTPRIKWLVNRCKKFKHLSRRAILTSKNEIQENGNQYLKDFIEDNVHENLVWVKIKEIDKSENEVFDVSLPDIEGDKWCHSVLYNNFLGHQTPNGMNLYYKMWDDAINKRNEYVPIEINWYDVPGRDEEWRRSVISNIGELAFEQEFVCSFLGSSNTLISGSKLGALKFNSPLRSKNKLDIYEEPIKDHVYAITVDVARGVNKDYSAFSVIDITEMPYKQVAKFKDNQIKPLLFPYVIKDVAETYNKAYILCEVNDVGDQVATGLHDELEYDNMLMCSVSSRKGQIVGQNFSEKAAWGVKMQKNVKRIGCLNLKALIEEDKLLINDLDTINELSTFIAKNGSWEADDGKNDDLVLTLVIFAWLCTNQYFKDLQDQDLRKKLYEEKMAQEDDSVLPFGFVNLGLDNAVEQSDDGTIWMAANPEKEIEDLANLWNYFY
jgi:hypothetical protein